MSRVTWLQEEAPDTWATTRWLLDCKEAVVLWLSGAAVTDAAGASSWRLTDPATGDWDPAACDLLGVPMTRLAGVAAATDEAGPLTASAAATLGLPAGMPVFVGSGDVPASQLGSGALGPVTRISAWGPRSTWASCWTARSRTPTGAWACSPMPCPDRGSCGWR